MPSHDIIDNRNQKLVDKINCILESSGAAHFAVGYFFISGFTAINDRLNNIKQLRLLIGNTSNRETIEQIAQGYKRLELISDRIEAESYPKRSQNALRRNGISGQDLFTHLVQIYYQHDLHKLSERQNSELKSQPIPMIICSEELN